MNDDSDLLLSYAQKGDQGAFAEVVRRHLDFVYSVALRRVNGDCSLAEDICQEVFAIVARKAAALAGHPALKAWLFTAARYAAAGKVRSEENRRRREKEAHTMNELHSPAPSDLRWAALRPELDQAIDGLNERARRAVILRFFEGKTYGEIGRLLSITEDGARLRVDRALEALSHLLSRRGITSTAAAIALGLGSEVASAAPAGLAGAIAASAAARSGTAIAAGKAASLFLIMSSSKIVFTALGVLALVGLTTATYEYRARHADRDTARILADRQTAALESRLADSQARLKALEAKYQAAARATGRAPGSGRGATAAADGKAPMDPKNYRQYPPVLGFGSDIELPSVRKASLISKVAIEMNHLGPFFQAQTISPAAQQQIAAAISSYWDSLMDLSIAARSQGMTETGPGSAMGADARQLGQQYQSDLQQALGPAGYQQMQQYNATAPQQDVLSRLAGMLYYTSQPLTPSEGSQLMTILSANKAGSIGTGGYVNYGWTTAVIADNALDQASAVLSPSQLAALKQLQSMQQVPIARGEVMGVHH